MQVSRRDFLKVCGVSAAALGFSAADLARLEKALANPNAPAVIWLQGAGCTGCSVSFLNYISSTAPHTAAEVLVDNINLIYHPNLTGVAGQDAVDQMYAIYNAGNYILAVEGGVPTALGGRCCYAWTYGGADVTFQAAVSLFASRAAAILSIGTCAGWGGMSAAPPNPTAVQSVSQATARTTINIAGCPPHPDWVVWVVVQLLLGNPVPVDSFGRPTQFFSKKLHGECPRHDATRVNTFGIDNSCLRNLGCRGPITFCNCQSVKWNNKQNWCVDANSPCIGCTEPTFPGSDSFRKNY